MQRVFAYIAVAILVLVSACARVQVSQDYRPGIDFSRYTAYQWRAADMQESGDPRIGNPLLHERFQRAIDGEMMLRGLVLKAEADLQVAYNYTIRTKIETDPFGTTVGFGIGRHTRYGGVGFGTGGDVRQYDVGILVIDIFEKGSGSLLWRGTGSDRIAAHATPEETTAFVNRMVNTIMQQFPPAP